MNIESINESACIVYLGDQINEETAERVKQATDRIRATLSDVITDLVPSYTSVMVCYDLERIDRFGIQSRLRRAVTGASATAPDPSSAQTLELPVYYGPEVALDLDDVCEFAGLTADEVIRIHSEQSYRVYAIGFSPGFAFLGSTDARIAMPRKSTPRLKVPVGSVGIAGSQTAIYPSATPGGWQIVGRTPSKMVDWDSKSLALAQIGDRVKFRAIDRDEFIRLGGQFDEL
ncbi:5-oxoprolinase subunit PxpB [Marinobacter qingdaonensis]|uniref:5-oxoprolinase subunit PxpB n=1 Tax=Marinobacter qingdaonensis TaxID=3108486 RepID=A0ABU5NZL1_9GAMM|nr:5-oxoprolinase subunit PxpB [Marinobacter sp. ASW11-75]MEA1081137.1 5-oxoprolinase subunit PxpB [Marinobacter sp. ASW11-75]